jgi:hypothetical protein
MGGATIPNLELDNTANATLLNTDTRIENSLFSQTAKFQTGNFNLRLSPTAISQAQIQQDLCDEWNRLAEKELTADIAALITCWRKWQLPAGLFNNSRQCLCCC